MKLSELKPPAGSRKNRKRVGRGDGSGHGGTSTKGGKGQTMRSGGKTKRGFEGGQMPLTRRLPKRGFTNIFRKDVVIVNLSQLNGFEVNATVDPDVLLSAGLIKRKGDGVKVLGQGILEKALKVKTNLVSRGAKEKIEAAGGTVEVI
jgi:large subunit ribosomal protein L15